ncbi:GtrA family protein [Actibacterium ureilyticum]|uniref:GtrA family protein n=1 Tax=Actibacterium ureilyticum TaxID=1590614 RepID=UPI000BAA9B3B|nr:GtrA family protein [Actibacterium ureilyticum]
MSIRTRAELIQALRFGLVGGLSTLVHMAVAQGLLAFDLASLGWSNVLGFVTAFFVSFFGHYHFSFQRNTPFLRSMGRYGVIALMGFAVNNFVLIGLVAMNVLPESVALAIAIIIVPVGTFVASRFWGFTAAS